jgi:cysteine synthase A
MSGSGVLAAVGNTPMIELKKVVPEGAGQIFLKLEFENPTGSMKDRMARAAIEAAEADGRLAPGGTVVEYTGGTTGVSLAFVCAAKGYPLEIVYSDAFSEEKHRMMEAFGARITIVPSEERKINERLIKEMIRTAGEISQRPGHWFFDQLRNSDAVSGYLALGDEIWEQTGGEVTAFVHSVGSGHSLHGVTEALWAKNREVHIVAVEPAETAVLAGRPSGSHRIEGIGIGFIPPLWHRELVNEMDAVSSDESMAMARRLAREEGVLAGTSTGTNVVAAIRLAQRLGPKATIVTLAVDSGLRYLSTEVYRPTG